MTLVISLLTPTHAIQASDRRVISIRSGKIVAEDDSRNKAVVFRENWAFGFTGLAELGPSRRTDLWLAEALNQADRSLPPGDHDPRLFFDQLADQATEEFSGRRIARLPSELRRHAFVAVGWGRFPDWDQPLAYTALISNFHDGAVGELARARRSFHVFVTRAEPGSS